MQGVARARIGWTALALASAAPLLTARALTPAPGGLGTHTQLGLPPCGFLLLLGLPCPACGLTTAFAHLADGALRASLGANPLGLPIFLALLLLVPRALWESARPRPGAGLALGAREVRLVWLYCAALLAVWAVRVALAWPT